MNKLARHMHVKLMGNGECTASASIRTTTTLPNLPQFSNPSPLVFSMQQKTKGEDLSFPSPRPHFLSAFLKSKMTKNGFLEACIRFKVGEKKVDLLIFIFHLFKMDDILAVPLIMRYSTIIHRIYSVSYITSFNSLSLSQYSR